MINNYHDRHHQQCLAYKNKAQMLPWHFLVAVVKGFSAEVFAGQPIAFIRLQPAPKVSSSKAQDCQLRLDLQGVSSHFQKPLQQPCLGQCAAVCSIKTDGHTGADCSSGGSDRRSHEKKSMCIWGAVTTSSQWEDVTGVY